MTKLIKRTTIVAVVLLALIGTGGIVAFASGYITWGGTKDYNEAMANLELIGKEGQIVVNNLDEARETILVLEADNKAKQKDIDALEKTVKQKDELIIEKENTIAAKEAIIKERDATIVKNNERIEDLTKKVNDGNAFKEQLATKVTGYINEVNQVGGKGQRYDKMFDIINNNVHLIGVEATLSSNPGRGQTDKELDQAIKDMKNVNEKTESVLEIFKDPEEEPQDGN